MTIFQIPPHHQPNPSPALHVCEPCLGKVKQQMRGDLISMPVTSF